MRSDNYSLLCIGSELRDYIPVRSPVYLIRLFRNHALRPLELVANVLGRTIKVFRVTLISWKERH